MAFILIGALFVTPMLSYAMAVTRSGSGQHQKLARSEAVKGAFRTAMASPSKLYEACALAGLHQGAPLAGPNMGIPVSTECFWVKETQELDAAALRVSMTTTMMGSTAPAGTVGTPYDGSGNADETVWAVNDMSTVSTGGKILLPNLPAHALTHPSPLGYLMPSWAGTCRVYFPGTYNDPITITGTTPVFFTSGVYYFDQAVTVSGSAQVVVGGGAVDGCSTDQEAAFEALGAPSDHNISGYGATWIFGGAGRLVFNDATPGTGPSLQFNSRLVGDTDVGSLASRSVSIMSVNGVDSNGVVADFSLPGKLFVPRSYNDGDPTSNAIASGYQPSELRPTDPATTFPAIVDINLTSGNPAKLWIPGYISVPQGYVNIAVAPGMTAGKDVQLVGGVLAAYFTETVDHPEVMQAGIVNRVVQKTFKIVSTSATGAPQLMSTAIVQINDYGEYVVNSWQISDVQQ